ncbi:MAG: CheY-P-specific phosphatase CheC [Firmicutes bacterium]|nr:CheY-P-specific phosphatase CheC [Bacillota bacterium]
MHAFKIDDNMLDALKELANIGIGNAVTSLSQLLGEEKINMDIPVATLVPLQDAPESLGEEEIPVAGVYIKAAGDVDLTVLFVLSLDSAANLITNLIPGTKGGLDQMGISVLIEVGNILTGSYLNAVSLMTGLNLLPSPPQIAVDMSGAIISTVMAENQLIDDEVVLLRTTIRTMESRIDGNILILPDGGALEKIFSILGLR